MTFKELFKLSHREFIAYKTRSRAVIITIGGLFGLLFAILFVTQGLENIVLEYAGAATNKAVYLANAYDIEDSSVIFNRIAHFGGEIITLTNQQTMQIGEKLPTTIVVAKFTNLRKAYSYYLKTDATKLHYNPSDYQINELFSNQIAVYSFFHGRNKNIIKLATITLLITSIFILAFTLAHLIASNSKTFVLYRSIGASKTQVIFIYLTYLLELCAKAAILAIILALIISGVITIICWSYLLEQLTLAYPDAPEFWPILIGINWQCLATILYIFLAAPASFLLCLDQFSNQKIAERLKGD